LNPIRERYLEAYVAEHRLPVDNVRIKRIRTVGDFQAIADTLSTCPGDRVIFPVEYTPQTGDKLHFDDGDLTLDCWGAGFRLTFAQNMVYL
jgi:hypothetical protein